MNIFKLYFKKILLVLLLIFGVIVTPFEIIFKAFYSIFTSDEGPKYVIRKEINEFKIAIKIIFEELKK